MSKLFIPDQFQKGVQALALLSDDVVEVIAEALGTASSKSSKALASSIQRSTGDVSAELILEPLKALRALYRVRASSGTPLNLFVDEISDALRELNAKTFTKSKVASVKKKMSRLLGIKALSFSSKAQNLKTSEERTFCDSQVLTDLRPVFGEDVKDGPEGYIITYRLRIGYHASGGRHQDIYIALDIDDVQNLMRVVIQALAEGKSLEQRLNDL